MPNCSSKIITTVQLTVRNSFPSNFCVFVKTTVRAGILRPRANVSVANNACGREKKKTC